MRAFQRGGRSRFTLALLLLTAATLLTLDARSFGPVETFRDGVFGVLSPVREALDGVMDPFTRAWRGAFDYAELEAENAELRERIAELEGEDLREASARATLERFLGQAEVTFAQDIPQVVARVISGPVSSFEDNVTIDKGSDDGIEVGMAVVTGAGLVGRVDRVTADRSVIQLLTDTRMQVGVRLVNSQARGILRGQGSGRSPLLEVTSDVALNEGEILETSGLDRSLYPPDVPIGRLLRLGSEDDSAEASLPRTEDGTPIPGLDPVSTKTAEVELAARLDRLNFLTVLIWTPSG